MRHFGSLPIEGGHFGLTIIQKAELLRILITSNRIKLFIFKRKKHPKYQF